MFPSEVVQVVVFVSLLSLASEIVLYLWCYSTPSFRTINASINKQSRKLDSLTNSSSSSLSKSKKTERLEKNMKQEATKELAVLKVKQTVVVSHVKVAMWAAHIHVTCPNSTHFCAVSSGGCRHVHDTEQIVGASLH